MIQDSIYLKHYARIYGQAIYRSTALREIQLYYAALCFVTGRESAVRLKYLAQFGITDENIEHIVPMPANQSYIYFIMEIAERGNGCEILMAVLPCMLSYNYIFKRVAAQPGTADARYPDFMENDAEESYAQSCELWRSFAEEKCAALPDEEMGGLSRIFKRPDPLSLLFGTWLMEDEV